MSYRLCMHITYTATLYLECFRRICLVWLRGVAAASTKRTNEQVLPLNNRVAMAQYAQLLLKAQTCVAQHVHKSNPACVEYFDLRAGL